MFYLQIHFLVTSDSVRSYKMDKVTFVFLPSASGDEVEHAIIDHGNEEYTSMPTATYDEQQAQAALSTPNV